MHLAQRGFECGQSFGGGLYEQQDFLGLFDRALPAIDRSQIWNKADAGGETALDQSP